jgi:predicted CxxxxCH...CXXCH cytochrome family protein
MAERRDTSTDKLPGLSLWLVLVVCAMFAFTSCVTRRHESEQEARPNGCATCHGDPSRPGDALVQAAPPRDVSGGTEPGYPGVGAHLLHLERGKTHGAVACTECHVVPERTDSPGHADDGAPAEIVFGALAMRDHRAPSYDPVARTCSDTYCHRDAGAVWTEPRSSEAACGSCHGLPPPPPHPASEQCSNCHGEVVDAGRHFIAPELHVDGKVQLLATSCAQCHGSGEQGAPPPDTLGNTSASAIGVGAHAAHLSGGTSGRPLVCSECHRVPERPTDFEHADGLPAELRFSGVAKARSRSPRWERETARCSDTYCHGPSSEGNASPRWTEERKLGCTSCHGYPPPAPHPQLDDCSLCHGDVIADDDRRIVARARHVDGKVDVSFDTACNACHGSDNAAPPRDLGGSHDPTTPGVGAHQAHVLGSPRARAVPCAECHLVPDEVLAPGHVDTRAPAEVVFSGAAVAFGPGATYKNLTCSGTSCHGAVFPGTHRSGGTLTEPVWTRVDGTQAACGTCHALPPPRPHPYYADDCGRCHKNMTPDGSSFVRPDLHVDGVVTFDLPEAP